MRDNTVENKNPANKLIPPSDGLDWLLHLTTTSFLFLIPNDCEKVSNNLFADNEKIIPPTKKAMYAKMFSKTKIESQI